MSRSRWLQSGASSLEKKSRPLYGRGGQSDFVADPMADGRESVALVTVRLPLGRAIAQRPTTETHGWRSNCRRGSTGTCLCPRAAHRRLRPESRVSADDEGDLPRKYTPDRSELASPFPQNQRTRSCASTSGSSAARAVSVL